MKKSYSRVLRGISFLMAMILSLIIADGLIRVYLAFKNRDTQYLKFTARINYPMPEPISPAVKASHKGPKSDVDIYARRKVYATTNSLGFRGKEFAPQKSPGTVRICVVGDSVVLGYGVKDDETFPVYLSSFLGNGFEVINCGFNGTNMEDAYKLVRNQIVNYSTDMIIVYTGYNDAFGPGLVRSKNMARKLHEDLYYRWMLYTILLEKYSMARYKTATPFIYLERKMPNYYYNYLDSIIKLAKAKAIEVVLVKVPLAVSSKDAQRDDNVSQLEAKYAATSDEVARSFIRHYYYTHKMDELAKNNGLLCIDTIPAMERRKELFFDEVHLNPHGNRILARLIADAIMSKTNINPS